MEVSSPLSLNRIEEAKKEMNETYDDPSSSNNISSAMSIDDENSRKTWDFSKTSSLYGRIISLSTPSVMSSHLFTHFHLL